MSATPVETVARRPGIVASARRSSAVSDRAGRRPGRAVRLRRRDTRRLLQPEQHLLDARAGVAARHGDALGQTLCVLIGGIDFSIAAWIAWARSCSSSSTGREAGRSARPRSSSPRARSSVARRSATSATAGGRPLIVTLAMGAIVTGAFSRGRGASSPAPRRSGSRRSRRRASTTFGITVPPLVFIWGVLRSGWRSSCIGAERSSALRDRDQPARGEIALVARDERLDGRVRAERAGGDGTGVLLAGFAAAATRRSGSPTLATALPR